MQIEVKNDTIEKLIPLLEKDKAFADLVESWGNVRSTRYGSKTQTLYLSSYKTAPLKRLYEHAKILGDRSIMMNITALLGVRSNPAGARVSQIQTLTTALAGYLVTDIIDGWLYKKRADGFYLPYVVTSIKYTPPGGRGDDRSPAFVTVSLAANIAKLEQDREHGNRYRRSAETESLTFYSDNLPATPAELFEKQGFFKETKELRAQYDEQLEQFHKVLAAPNEQFWFKGNATEISSRNYWWGAINFEVREPIKVVNDEELVLRPYVEHADPSFWRNFVIDVDEEEENEDDEDAPKKSKPKKAKLEFDRGFDTTPVHPMALIFDLEKHEHLWAHTSLLTPYVYKPELRDVLVLPEEHRDMIDILATDLGVVVEDVVEGKSGGTLILCTGKPGLGKTLTPEVYSEVIGRPHYRVTAGVLGTEPDSVEKNLKIILKRAGRWNSVTTLDEADVYIRQRGDDLKHNAVVAAFLQQLEYFPGILFMTTNREEDVDDAISSRCAALLRYKAPVASDAFKIWKIQSKLFDINLTDELTQQLVEKYPNASGRDIRNLCKITTKYLRAKGQEPNLEAFRICAQFRGL